MISKEQIPSPAAIEPDPAELPDTLKQALRNAYPNPEGRIAAKVMEQIRAEKQLTSQQLASQQQESQPMTQETAEQQRRAERAERRRHRQGLIMKYGGMAACMVILSGALVLASPLMGRTADNAAAEQAVMTADYAADTAAPAEAVYSVKTKSTADADAANGAVEAEEEVPMMLFSTRPASAAKEADDAAEEAAPVLLLADNAAAYDDTDTREAFLQYLITEGHLTEEDFTLWQSTLDDADAWTPESLCSAFRIDETLYDTWLKK